MKADKNRILKDYGKRESPNLGCVRHRVHRLGLHLDGDQVPPAEPGWSNPYRTHPQTKAFFSFWPHPAKGEQEVVICQILFTAEHPDYESLARTESISTRGAFERNTAIYGEEVVNIGTLRLKPKVQE